MELQKREKVRDFVLERENKKREKIRRGFVLERENMRICELCKSPARMYCESDRASLCWDCDFKVHGANFLVARHSRTLLCQSCQSPTPWSAAGAKLGPTVSICEICSGDKSKDERESCSDDDDDDEVDGADELDLDGDDDEIESEFDEEEQGENQVVPWSNCAEIFCVDDRNLANSSSPSPLKRIHESSSDLDCQENVSRPINRWENNPEPTTSDKDEPYVRNEITRQLKKRRTEPVSGRTAQSRPGWIKESMVRINGDIASGQNTPAGLAGLYKLSRDLEAD